MSNLHWYWHRLRAMDPKEWLWRAHKKCRQFADARIARDWASVKLERVGTFPQLPLPQQVREAERVALQRDRDSILPGHWRAFGHLDLKVDDPPKWHCDYLAGRDLSTAATGFQLNHRKLPAGADIKLIWELSRWHPLTRLAMAAHVLADEQAGEKCIVWLEDWVTHNPPFRGWNWTSALESGLRLVQFTWIDALLAPQAEAWGVDAELETLRYAILPSHVWFTWRHRSFGSSANNHLIGELAGLILATVRWPALAQWGAPLAELQRHWEHEVLAQFAPDGGNREQALNYHLFSWEFCWQARMALLAAGRKISPGVEHRLNAAARFFWEVQAQREAWDYGDSDDAFVMPFLASGQPRAAAWRDWMSGSRMRGSTRATSLTYWLGEPPVSPPRLAADEPLHARPLDDWWFYERSGLATCELGFWRLRWDLSALGYLRTAAHGHLDALHLSIWYNGVAMVIDPGTGAYYADPDLRAWLASRAAHNGPCPADERFPRRLGPFLWSAPHAVPTLLMEAGGLSGSLDLPGLQMSRGVAPSPDGLGWQVEDKCLAKDGTSAAFTVRWQFAPGTHVKILEPRRFGLHRSEAALVLEAGHEWSDVKLVENPADRGGDWPLAGKVSPAFRTSSFAPYLLLTAGTREQPCVFRTTFLASPGS